MLMSRNNYSMILMSRNNYSMMLMSSVTMYPKRSNDLVEWPGHQIGICWLHLAAIGCHVGSFWCHFASFWRHVGSFWSHVASLGPPLAAPQRHQPEGAPVGDVGGPWGGSFWCHSAFFGRHFVFCGAILHHMGPSWQHPNVTNWKGRRLVTLGVTGVGVGSGAFVATLACLLWFGRVCICIHDPTSSHSVADGSEKYYPNITISF